MRTQETDASFDAATTFLVREGLLSVTEDEEMILTQSGERVGKAAWLSLPEPVQLLLMLYLHEWEEHQ